MLVERFKRISTTLIAQDDDAENDQAISNALDEELVKWVTSAEAMGINIHYRITNYDSTFIPETPINPGCNKLIISIGIAYIANPK